MMKTTREYFESYKAIFLNELDLLRKIYESTNEFEQVKLIEELVGEEVEFDQMWERLDSYIDPLEITKYVNTKNEDDWNAKILLGCGGPNVFIIFDGNATLEYCRGGDSFKYGFTYEDSEIIEQIYHLEEQ